jgi:hypothetical protein
MHAVPLDRYCNKELRKIWISNFGWSETKIWIFQTSSTNQSLRISFKKKDGPRSTDPTDPCRAGQSRAAGEREKAAPGRGAIGLLPCTRLAACSRRMDIRRSTPRLLATMRDRWRGRDCETEVDRGLTVGRREGDGGDAVRRRRSGAVQVARKRMHAYA